MAFCDAFNGLFQIDTTYFRSAISRSAIAFPNAVAYRSIP